MYIYMYIIYIYILHNAYWNHIHGYSRIMGYAAITNVMKGLGHENHWNLRYHRHKVNHT